MKRLAMTRRRLDHIILVDYSKEAGYAIPSDLYKDKKLGRSRSRHDWNFVCTVLHCLYS